MITERIRRGEKVIGAFVRLNDPQVIDVIASAGADYVVIDMEHAPLDLASVSHLVLAAGRKVHCVVRVPGYNFSGLYQLLDLGPDAVLFPHVETEREAVEIRRACLFPPEGKRPGLPSSLEAYRVQRSWSDLSVSSDERAEIWILIESVAGFDALAAILEGAKPDLVMLGMFDLALDAGLPVPNSDSWDPGLIAFAENAIKACEVADIPVSMTSQVPDAALPLLRRCGALFAGSDVGYVHAGMATAVQSHRQHMDLPREMTQ